jgi:hypothetical protein
MHSALINARARKRRWCVLDDHAGVKGAGAAAVVPRRSTLNPQLLKSLTRAVSTESQLQSVPTTTLSVAAGEA